MSDTLDSRDGAALALLANAAMSDFADGPVLPAGWSLARSFIADPWLGAGQGLIALGQLPSDPTTPVAVLALGVPWGTLLATALAPQTASINPPPGILPGPGQVVIGASNAYLAVRDKLWAALPYAGGRPLYVTGLYLGGPMAQLAGIDLRPNHNGPGNSPSPVPVVGCVAFSSPGPGDSQVAAMVAQNVPAAWTLSRQHLGEMIDYFPVSLPATNVEAGQQMVLPASISQPIDDPWMERTASAYITSLGETPPPGPPVRPAGLAPIPAGFSAGKASNYARMLSLPYLQRQHPGASSPLSFAPYATYPEPITLRGKTLATVMTWDKEAVLCFRGSVDWYEWGHDTINSNLVRPPFPAPSTALIHAGALAAYQEVPADGKESVKAQLTRLLPELSAKYPDLFFAGHAFGVAVAVIAAMDLLAAGTISKAPTFYTYGELMTGNSDFVTKAQEQLNRGYYPITRPGDFMPKALQFQGYSPIAERLILSGVPVNDEPTNHALTGYMELLSPYASGSARLASPVVLAPGVSATGSPTLA